MIKNFFYIVFLLLLTTLVSCDSDDPDYSINGRWLITERKFTCSDISLQNGVNNNLMPNYLKKGDNNYLEFDKSRDPYVYTESLMRWLEIGTGESKDYIEVDVFSYTGFFSTNAAGNEIEITLKNLGDGDWTYTVDVLDINSEFIYIKQEMTTADLRRFMQVYFSSIGAVPDGTTAVWTRKARKVKE